VSNEASQVKLHSTCSRPTRALSSQVRSSLTCSKPTRALTEAALSGSCSQIVPKASPVTPMPNVRIARSDGEALTCRRPRHNQLSEQVSKQAGKQASSEGKANK
jgi:hypothetical protein